MGGRRAKGGQNGLARRLLLLLLLLLYKLLQL